VDKNFQVDCESLGKLIVYQNEEAFFSEISENNKYDIIIGVGQTPGSKIRQNIWDKLIKRKLKPINLIHPQSIVAKNVIVNSGVQVFAGAVIQQDASIGSNVIINTRSIIEHDVEIGKHSHVAPGSIILGNVKIGESVFIGAGTLIREGICIGDNTIIGMGSTVLKDVPSNIKVTGLWKG
jgi:UDP-perosamine 4-acetyltransferase